MNELAPEAVRRYLRHLTLPEVGQEGQARLGAASVLLVGAGGLGSPVALYLTAAGVGRLGLADPEQVEISNLQRQVLYGEASVGERKVVAARARLSDLNHLVRVETFDLRLSGANAFDILAGYDVVVDGSDNFPTRYLLSDACVLARKPLVYGSIFRFEGQLTVFDATRGPCYRCLFPEPPPPALAPSCAEGGVLGVLPGIVGALQANEVLKLVLGIGEPLVGRLLLIDALSTRTHELRVPKAADCPACGSHPSLTSLIDYEGFCSAGAGGPRGDGMEVSPREAADLAGRGEAELLDVRERNEWRLVHLPGARLIPLGELSSRLGELDRSSSLVVYCHVGRRSRYAVELLRHAGFARAQSLAGGIDAWSREVDPSLARY
jgi:molybdopterin/thiamine biosynthesis adenylyltransferase/rhodanese-related sulfurtransferase